MKIRLITVVFIIILIITVLLVVLTNKSNDVKKQSRINEKIYEFDDTKDFEKYFIKAFYYGLIKTNSTSDNFIEYLSINKIYSKYESLNSFIIDVDINHEQFYYLLMFDYTNQTYELKQLSKEEFDSNKEDILLSGRYDNNVIAKNGHSNSTIISNDFMAQYYYEAFNNLVNKDTERAYELLDLEYKQKRFPTLDTFKQYADSLRNLDETFIINLSVNETSEYTEYVATDNLGRVTVLKVNGVQDYTVQLDNYTLENEQFNETYNSAPVSDKAYMNCERFFEMLNMHDYKTAYGKLDENFKATYFKTEEEFVAFMQNSLYRFNKATYSNYDEQVPGIHRFIVRIYDATGEKETPLEMNIVIKLLSGTDFVMSFGSE